MRSKSILAAAALAVLSFSVAGVGTFAWFQLTQNVTATGLSVKVKSQFCAVSGFSIFPYLGESDDGNYFGFNPTPAAVYSVTGSGISLTGGDGSVELHSFSLDDPHHPCLILFSVSGSLVETISATTTYPFFAASDSDYTISGTFASFAALNAAANHTSGNDEKYFRVTNDETVLGTYVDENSVTKKVPTIYHYDYDTESFDRVWIDFAKDGNPISSVVSFSSLPLASAPSATTKNLYLYTGSNPKEMERDDHTTSTSCYAIDRRLLTSTSSFAEFEDEAFLGYENQVTIYSGDVSGYSCIAVVVDYIQDAVEYISSFFLGHDYLMDGMDFAMDMEIGI